MRSCWAKLGPSWDQFGQSRDQVGPSCHQVGHQVGFKMPSSNPVGYPKANHKNLENWALAQTRAQFLRIEGSKLGPSWHQVEPSWDQFGPSWDQVEPSWDQVGPYVGLKMSSSRVS